MKNTSRFAGLARFARGLAGDDGVLVLQAGDDPEPKPAPGEDDEPETEPGGDDEPDEGAPPEAAAEKKKKDKQMASGAPTLDLASFGEGAKAERERHQAVFASEHYAGREAQANKLLANGKLEADEIVALLADAPKSGGTDPLAGMGGNNPDLGAGDGADPDPKARASASWDKTFDRLGWAGK